MEKHSTWSTLRKHEGMKLISFKLLNVLAFYLGAFLASKTKEVLNNANRCYMEDTGLKFLTLILTDMFVFNFIEICVPLIKSKVTNSIRSLRNTGGDDDAKPEFDVAQEYLELFYRQFVIYIGTLVFPLMSVCGLISNVIEFPLDKYRMMRICKKPQRLDLSMKSLLLFWMVSIAVIALVGFPQGPIWVMGLQTTFLNTYGCCPVLNGPFEGTNCTYYFGGYFGFE